MKALHPCNTEQLFCWHAILQSSPLDGFEELVEEFVEACNGLPLSLKIFGGLLYGNLNKKYWESLLHRILLTDIKERLKISYSALDDEEKEVFLDIACFLIGEKESSVIEVFEGSAWSGLYTWERLVNKCLVEVDDKNYIRMHDHLRDMGRKIASQHSPSRIWLSQQIINYANKKERRNGIRGITTITTGMEELLSYREEVAPYLAALKLLVMRGDYFNQIINEVWLRWSEIGQRNLPPQHSLKNLRVLQLEGGYFGKTHLEELWEAESDGCGDLILRSDDFQNITKLEFLDLSGCNQLEELPRPITNQVFLREFYLDDLQRLREIKIGQLSRLQKMPEIFAELLWKFVLFSSSFHSVL
ncbi:disease resistance protein Roq1-like [Cryptomeria japonica]|uniref:disease resistance protein Roq1-like n=1 Tax=Cryptomeria japonica TaxID=3369 RepID=UPI0027D9EDA4|nr:disease resistance protein Roq1-like [Cryptomeria japonica]